MLNPIMRADALIGVTLTDGSKSTKKKDVKTKNATERDKRAGSVKDDAHPYYYKVPDVSTNSRRDEIKKAYRRLSMLYHPERLPTRMPRRR